MDVIVAVLARRDLARIRQDLVGTRREHAPQRLRRAQRRLQLHRAGESRRRHRLGARQHVATLGFAAHVEPQSKTRHPRPRRRDDRLGGAAVQFDFKFADRQPGRPGGDRSGVERQLDAAVGVALEAAAAVDVGAVAHAQAAHTAHAAHATRVRTAGTGGLGQVAEHRVQPVAGWRAGVQRRVDLRHRRAGDQHVVLQPRHAVVGCTFQRLHPLPALAAHAQRQPGLRQRAPGGVAVGGLQAHARQRRTAGHSPVKRRALGLRHLELQFDFMHDAIQLSKILHASRGLTPARARLAPRLAR